jgi:hypothetical protein
MYIFFETFGQHFDFFQLIVTEPIRTDESINQAKLTYFVGRFLTCLTSKPQLIQYVFFTLRINDWTRTVKGDKGHQQ